MFLQVGSEYVDETSYFHGFEEVERDHLRATPCNPGGGYQCFGRTDCPGRQATPALSDPVIRQEVTK